MALLSSHLLLLISLLLATSASAELHIPLTRRKPSGPLSPADFKALRENTITKYSGKKKSSTAQKRQGSTGNVPLTNLGFDTTYFGTMQIGSQGKSFNVILDTGSSDLFIASNQCQSCGNVQTLSTSDSSTLQVSQSQVDLKFGSGETTGTLAQDKVSMGGFTISNQTFVLSTQVTQGLLQGSLSGLLGLGFESIAQTQATPFVQALSQGNGLSSPEMAFFLDRLINVQTAQDEAPGGTFTIGGTNSSLFTGDIDFVNMPSGVQPSFWLQPVTQVGIQGTTLSVQSGTTSLAAIDTGTTLIGGPTDAVTSVYQSVQGSQQLSGQMQGYFSIPCDTSVSMSFTFSSKTWGINPVDFNVQQLQGNTCLGALFALDLGSDGAPDWVIGDTFLKNVYSVFRFNPPSVGFAQLASGLEGSSSSAAAPVSSKTISAGGGGPLPTTSIGGSSPTDNPFGNGGGGGGGGGSGKAFTVTATSSFVGLAVTIVCTFVGGLLW